MDITQKRKKTLFKKFAQPPQFRITHESNKTHIFNAYIEIHAIQCFTLTLENLEDKPLKINYEIDKKHPYLKHIIDKIVNHHNSLIEKIEKLKPNDHGYNNMLKVISNEK